MMPLKKPVLKPSLSPVIALHGFTGSGEDFLPFLNSIPRRLTALNLPGHTPNFDRASAPKTFDAAVEELSGHIETPCILWGYSMGGRLALSLAIRYPEKVRGLLLVGASPGLEDEDHRRIRRQSDEELATRTRKIGTAAFLEEWSRHPLIRTQRSIDPEIRRAMRARRREHSAEGLAYALEVLGTGCMPSLWPALPRLECPVLAVYGQTDTKYGAIAQRMNRVHPAIRPVEVQGAGHCAHLENVDAFIASVRDFFDTPD